METNDLTYQILKCAYKAHSALGPGLLESTYETIMVYELKKAGLKIEVQKAMPLKYENETLDVGYRIDILVEDQVIVEIKAVKELHDNHAAQILTYMKLSGYKTGLLINFNVISLKDGIRRFVI